MADPDLFHLEKAPVGRSRKNSWLIVVNQRDSSHVSINL